MNHEIRRCCDSCGNTFDAEQITAFDGQMLCPACLERATVTCVHCGERIWRDENAGDESTPLCQHCYDRWYQSCSCCGRILHEDDVYYRSRDDDEPLCLSCYNREQDHQTIQEYYYKPEPLFRGDGPRYFGVELEIDEAGEDNDSARRIMKIANGNGLENLYCKHDGSLDDGFVRT